MTAATRAQRRGIGPIRPRIRGRELGLLMLVFATLIVGDVSLGMAREHRVAFAEPQLLGSFLAALVAAHVAQVLAGRRTDQVLLPIVGMLGGISLLFMIRIGPTIAATNPGLAAAQRNWLLLCLLVLTVGAIVIRSDTWLRMYKYSWAAAGILLLLLAFVLPKSVNGAELNVRIGPLTGQPSELLKVILVVFLSAYLSENRELLSEQATRVGRLRLPPLPYLIPMVTMLGISLLIVVVQKDLGAALLFFAVFLILLYIATGRPMYVVLGLIAFLAGGAVLYELFGVVRDRVDVWLNPWGDPTGTGYQIIQGLYAFGRGGVLGTGLGGGIPLVGGQPAVPLVHSDFVFAGLGEELGLVGLMAILGLYLVLIERGLRIAASAADTFRSLLAAGLTLVVGVQAFVIAAGNLKLIPLTGITLPFVSYGGSSLLANGLVVGLLLALSDRGVEPPPPPRRGRRRDAAQPRGAAL